MSTKRLSAIFLVLICLRALGIAQAQRDDAFARFFEDFQSAVKAGDKEKIASTIKFDHFDWEASEALREVKTKESFLKNYPRMFTAVIKSKIAAGKPIKTEEGYYIEWHTRDLEYSLYFFRERDDSFSFLGLTVGPR